MQTESLTEYLPPILVLLVLIIVLVLLAQRIRVAYPILLVLAGLGLSFIPNLPRLHIDPDIIFFMVLPPLLFEAAWAISQKELWRWRKIILSFAFLVVFFTATVVAFVAERFIPGFSLALGFLLGGIVSPPDAVSMGAILKFVKVPKATSSILEGESLMNDASSLIIIKFALIAIGTGHLVWGEVAASFSWMVIGGPLVGIILAYLFLIVHKFLPNDKSADILLLFIQPYLMYLLAEEVGSSGVLAVVSGGLLLSRKQYRSLTASTRVGLGNVWESFSFLLNGVVFMVIGLDLPEIIEGLKRDGVSIGKAIGFGVLITVILILVRIVSYYISMLSALFMRRKKITKGMLNGWQFFPIVMGWTGMRGVISLAAALAIPNFIGGNEFPHRSLIIFISFTVIVLTLVVQGLTLPYMIKAFRWPEPEISDEDLSIEIEREKLKFSIARVREKYGSEIENNPTLSRVLSDWEKRIALPDERFMDQEKINFFLRLYDAQRQFLLRVNAENPNMNEDIIREKLYVIDLEEERIRHFKVD